MPSLLKRDHLFINYATEDSHFAEWLAKILTREGYNVWIDKYKLLGGESFPVDIEKAIRERTFRFLALMSHSSVHKDTPLQERTLATKIKKKLGINDFIIPLIIDGLSPDDLDLHTTNISAIIFNSDWFKGIKNLLHKLEKIDTPRDRPAALKRLSSLITQPPNIISQGEELVTNLLEIKSIPERIFHYQNPRQSSLGIIQDFQWRYYRNEIDYWSFNEAPIGRNLKLKNIIDWKKEKFSEQLIIENIIRALIRRCLSGYCEDRGLKWNPRFKRLYFPVGLLPQNKIYYHSPILKKNTSVLVSSLRKSHTDSNGKNIQYRYHLAPKFSVLFEQFNKNPLIAVQSEFYFTNLNGIPYQPKRALGLRKKLLKNQYNAFWLKRNLALASWLVENMECVIFP